MTPTRITRQTSCETGCVVTSGAGQVELTALMPGQSAQVVLTPERAVEVAEALLQHAGQWTERTYVDPSKWNTTGGM